RKNSAGPLTELVNVKLVVGEQHKVLKIAGCRRRVMLKPVQGVIDPWRRERSQGFGLTAPAPPCAIHDSVVSQSQIGHIKMIAQYIAQIGGVVSRYVLAFLKGKVQRNGRV